MPLNSMLLLCQPLFCVIIYIPSRPKREWILNYHLWSIHMYCLDLLCFALIKTFYFLKFYYAISRNGMDRYGRLPMTHGSHVKMAIG